MRLLRNLGLASLKCLRVRVVALVAGLLVSTTGGHCGELAAGLPSRDGIVRAAAENAERTWRGVNRQPPTVGSRELFSAALAWCEAKTHLDRLEKLFDLAAQMQDRDPQSRTYGNFRWNWHHEGVWDLNAVDFCMQMGALLWIHHQQTIPPAAREKLREILELAIHGLIGHRVPETYTNIALMNAGNLILLGEAMDKPDAASEGYARLDRFLLAMWESGTHEYCSPTYYGVDLDDLVLIEAFARQERGRQQARVLLEYFWRDIALNWFPPAQKLGGARSRDYDYLRGLGFLDQQMMANGWLPTDAKNRVTHIVNAFTRWRPPARLKEMSETRFPRLVQQIWGFEPAESRTHYLCRDVTLSVAGANYRTMDIPLSADLPGPREGVRCYFIPDGRHDPYGKIRIQEGKAHAKTLHLTPFWAAAQRRVDALGVALYRDKDVPPETQTLESHFVMPLDVDSFWIGGRRVDTPKDKPWEFPLNHGEALVLRKGTAAVGVRVPWAQDDAPVSFVFDGNKFGAVRLTVAHQVGSRAGAAFWVRIGSELRNDAAFEKWQRQFAAARSNVEAAGERVRISVSGADGAVTVGADAAKSAAFGLEPMPPRALLAVDGEDIGRRLLQDLEPIRSWRATIAGQTQIAVPKGKSVYWEAEAGRVVPPMTRDKDAKAVGGAFVWMPAKPGEKAGSSVGHVAWQLKMAAPGKYYVWGRVQAPTPSNDSFYVRLFSDEEEILGRTDWPTGVRKDWEWIPLAIGGGRAPTALDLPSGLVNFQLRVREAGTKMDRLFITPRADERPR
ncbi:MAG: hypothetical protein FJ395_06780 [Verrucomicrobia bacterium]|nr:hypothetical protein [Verrucomicrobiota bacterium]